VVGRQPSNISSGVDYYFSLSLDSTDVLKAGDQLTIPFEPWLGYNPGTAASVVDRFQSSSGVDLPPCGVMNSVCASNIGFGPAGFFNETVITPLSVEAFHALEITFPAAAARGIGNLGIVQTTFTYTTSSDITGPLFNIGFFLAHFGTTTNPPPAPVLCPAAVKLVDPQGNLRLNALGTPSLNEDCDSLNLQPHVLGAAPLNFGPPERFLVVDLLRRNPQGGLGECPAGVKAGEGTCVLLAISAIPEPATILLLCSGFIGFLVMRKTWLRH